MNKAEVSKGFPEMDSLALRLKLDLNFSMNYEFHGFSSFHFKFKNNFCKFCLPIQFVLEFV